MACYGKNEQRLVKRIYNRGHSLRFQSFENNANEFLCLMTLVIPKVVFKAYL